MSQLQKKQKLITTENKITAIRQQTKNPLRFNIFVDGHYYLSLTQESILKLKIKIGKTITPEIEIQLFQEKITNYLLNASLNFISYRPRSIQEIRNYLYLKKINLKKTPTIDQEKKKEIIETIIQKLKKLKLADEEQFTQWWIENRVNSRKPKGSKMIYAELRKKGISPQVIKEKISSLDLDETSQALKILRKKKGLHKREKIDYKEKQKILNYLARRGFPYENALKAFDLFVQEGYNQDRSTHENE